MRKQLAQRPVFWLRMSVLAVVTGLLAAGLVLYFLRARGRLARPVLCMTNAVSVQVWSTCTRTGMSHVLLVAPGVPVGHASALPCFAYCYASVSGSGTSHSFIGTLPSMSLSHVKCVHADQEVCKLQVLSL